MDIVFYIGAHQDDALLFCGETLYKDLHNHNIKVVCIYITAGDAGRTNGWWQARELGAVTAIKATLSPSQPESGPIPVQITTHVIHKYTYGNTVSYFMRLPDGYLDNGGRESTHYQTLCKLRDGQIATITAVDESATYYGWTDFCDTLQAIMTQEITSTPNLSTNLWVRASDYDSSRDPYGHPDHYATGDAVKAIIAAGTYTYNRAWWLSYTITNRTARLSTDSPEYENKKALFYAYGKTAENYMQNMGIKKPLNQSEWDAWGAYSDVLCLSCDQHDPLVPDLALNKAAWASSTLATDYDASKANNGDINTGWSSAKGDTAAWWEVDLGQPYAITQIQLVTRQDQLQGDTLHNFEIWASNTADMSQGHVVLGTQSGDSLPHRSTWTLYITNPSLPYPMPYTPPYRYIAAVKKDTDSFFIAELRVMGVS